MAGGVKAASTFEVAYSNVRQAHEPPCPDADQLLVTPPGELDALTIPVEGWSGPAAGNADSAHRSLMSRVEKMAAGMSIISKSIGQASDAILGVQHAITNAEELAWKYGYQVADNAEPHRSHTAAGATLFIVD